MRKYKETCLKNSSGIIPLHSGDLGIDLSPYTLLTLRSAINLREWVIWISR